MRGRRRQIQTTTNTTLAAPFPKVAAMASSTSLQSFLPPSAHATTSSSQHRPNRARPFQCAAVSAPSSSVTLPSALAVRAERVELQVERLELRVELLEPQVEQLKWTSTCSSGAAANQGGHQRAAQVARPLPPPQAAPLNSEFFSVSWF